MRAWYSAARMSNTAEVQETGDARIYEVGFHLIPKIAEADMPAEVEKIKGILSQHGVSVIAEEAPRMIQLTYSMSRPTAGRRDRYNQAWFGWIKFEGGAETVEPIGKAVDAMPAVLRSILISTTRESTLAKKVFVSEHLSHETIRKPEMAPDNARKMSDAEIDTAVEELIETSAEEAPKEEAAPEVPASEEVKS